MQLRKSLILPRRGIIPNIFPRRLHRTDLPEYLLSNTFERRLGGEFPRREVLMGLAAAASLVAFPARPARAISISSILKVAKGTLDVLVDGVELIKDVFEVKEHTSGTAVADNKSGHSEHGTIVLAIVDESNEMEMSEGRKYTVGRYTTATLTFHNAPAPQEEGAKEFWVIAVDDADSANFEATA